MNPEVFLPGVICLQLSLIIVDITKDDRIKLACPGLFDHYQVNNKISYHLTFPVPFSSEVSLRTLAFPFRVQGCGRDVKIPLTYHYDSWVAFSA